jgi:hypothetical protein
MKMNTVLYRKIRRRALLALLPTAGSMLLAGMISVCCAGCQSGTQQAQPGGPAGDTLRISNAFWLAASAGHESRVIRTLLADPQPQWAQDSVMLPGKYGGEKQDLQYRFTNQAQDRIVLRKSGYDGQYFLEEAYLNSSALALSPELRTGQDIAFLDTGAMHRGSQDLLIIAEDEEGYTQLQIRVKDRTIASIHLINTID